MSLAAQRIRDADGETADRSLRRVEQNVFPLDFAGFCQISFHNYDSSNLFRFSNAAAPAGELRTSSNGACRSVSQPPSRASDDRVFTRTGPADLIKIARKTEISSWRADFFRFFPPPAPFSVPPLFQRLEQLVRAGEFLLHRRELRLRFGDDVRGRFRQEFLVAEARLRSGDPAGELLLLLLKLRLLRRDIDQVGQRQIDGFRGCTPATALRRARRDRNRPA